MKNRKLAIGLAASLTFAMAGCTTVNPYTQEQQTSKAAIGAGVGAVTGAIVGAMKGDRRTALKGAALGAAAGGGAIDQSYSATLAVDGLKYCWKRYEAECGVDANTGLRIGGFCAEFSRAHPSVTFVVCTHGGPSASCFEYLTGRELVQSVGYTAIHILIKDQESTLAGTSGRWRALVTGSTRHLND